MTKIKFQNFIIKIPIWNELEKIGNKKALERFLEETYGDEEWEMDEYGYVINSITGDSLTRQILKFGNTYYFQDEI